MDIKKIIGVSIRTTNKNGQAYADLGQLWSKFFENSERIPNKLSNDIYAIYTDYETDYTGKYTAIVGYEVASFELIPDGFVGKEIGGGTYIKFIAKGEMPNAIAQTWQEIWEKEEELNRRYTTDFEVHTEHSQKGKDSEVEIFIAIK